MSKNAFHAALAAALVSFASVVPAQTPPSVDSGQGMSKDGSGPADGALTGGSLRQGETGGVPTGVPGIGGGSNTPPDRGNKRCNELTGTLREQCLLQEQGASTGGSRSPDTGEVRAADPRVSPPPQNPR